MHPALVAQRAALAQRARVNRQNDSSETETMPASAEHAVSINEGPTPGGPGGQGAGSNHAPQLAMATITDATTHPMGVVVLDRNLREVVVPLIPESTPLPCERKGRFAYAYDGMTAVRVEVTEGAGAQRDEVEVIGEVVLENLPPRARGTPIEVVYRYTVNQILEVDVTDVETRAVRRARMDLKGGLGRAGVLQARENLSKARVT